MKFEQLLKLKDAINTFEDASFVSLLGESEAVIAHPNGSIWSLPFSITEGKISFHPARGSILEGTEQEEDHESDVAEINAKILQAVSDKNEEVYKEGLEELLSKFKAKKIEKKESVTESVIPGTLFESLDDSQKEWVLNFEARWSSKVEKARESYLEFFQNGLLFDENGLKNVETLGNPIEILEAYQEKIEAREAFFAQVESIISWKEKVTALSIDESVLEKINPLSKNWKNDLTKHLLLWKKESGSEISIPESVSEISKIHAELFESDATVVTSLGSDRVPNSYNGETKLSFLKLGGIYSTTDLEKLIEDFSFVLGSWGNKGQDEFQGISKMKDRVDYMYRTGMIDDEEVTNIISSFNSKYGRDGRDAFRNPEMTSGGTNWTIKAPETNDNAGE